MRGFLKPSCIPFSRSRVTVIALMAIVFAQTAHAQPRVRYNIKDVSAADQQLFVDAMFALRNPANFAPPGGWPADTNLPQNRYEQLVRSHDTNHMFIHTHHGPPRPPVPNTWFLPWHRAVLFQMENDVRSLGGQFANFTLAYWDGTRDVYPKDKKGANPGDPPVANGLLGGNGDPGNGDKVTDGPFANPTNINCNCKWQDYKLTGTGTPGNPFTATRNPLRRTFGADADNDRRFDQLTSFGPVSLAALLAVPNYSDLLCGGNDRGLEASAGLHDDHHVAVGGQLGNPTTGSTDPTFWLLHSYIDLLWARWESIHGPLYDDLGQAGRSLNDPMSSVGETGTWGLTQLDGANIYNHSPGTDGKPEGSVTAADVLNYLTMPLGGYTYDYRPNPNTDDRVLLGAPVPEPAALGLLAGLAVLLPWRRRINVRLNRTDKPLTSRH